MIEAFVMSERNRTCAPPRMASGGAVLITFQKKNLRKKDKDEQFL
jgi:hypothetical protein